MLRDGDVTSTLAAVLEVATLVLQKPNLMPESDFFEMGGDSLAAIEVVWRLNERFSVSISLTDLFDAPDFLSLAETVDKKSLRAKP